MEGEMIVGILVQGLKKRDALNMIPMKMGEEYMRIDGAGTPLGHQALAEVPEPGSAVEDVDVVVDPDLDAGGVSAVLHVFQLRGRSGASNAPELDLHASPNGKVEGRKSKPDLKAAP
jgi:hypothetical protein